MSPASKPALEEFDAAAPVREVFLGVRRSARGLAWYDRLGPGGANVASAIAQRHDVPEILGRILAARGIGLDGVEQALDPRLKTLMPDPTALRDMEQGAGRIADAIMQRETVAIFGDYDVDGGASAALMKRFFVANGHDARIYIPDRLSEGYGPNRPAIESLIDEGARLIITVDCGTTSEAALGFARGRGVDVIVVDHHQADEVLPDVHSLINPNRQDDLSGQGGLAAAGVVFLVLVATARVLRARGWYCEDEGRAEPGLMEWLDLVALATVCDVVPLQGLNRAYVTRGLQVMRLRRNVGLRALADTAGLKSAPTPYHLGFLLGPRINAGGRIGDSGLGARLLASDDEVEAARIAGLLDRLNQERKAMEQQILEQALADADAQIAEDPDRAILIAGSEDWHKGLVGLVASRLTERFRRPSLVLSWAANDEGTGSLRSIAGIDIGGAVRAAVGAGLLVKGGGHAMAAGLTVRRDNFGALEEFFDQRLRAGVATAQEAAGLDIDGAMTPAGATPEFLELLERAGPYGAGNPEPRFVFPAHRVKFAKVVGDVHVRCSLQAGDGRRIDAIAFRAAGSPLGDMLLKPGGLALHVAGGLKRDTWGGRTRTDLIIADAADPRAQS